MDGISRQIAAGRGLWLALLLTLVLALPGFFTLPPVDRDEVLFSQASRQMVQSGDFIDIRFADGPRYKKPVGIYWLQSATVSALGVTDQIWAYRVVSLLAALVAVGLTHATARLFLAAGPAFLAAMALGASLMLGAEAHLAKTDATLLATVAGCQYLLARGITGRLGKVGALGFWAVLALSVLVKGPIGPMVVAFTLAGHCLLTRSLALWRALRPLPGVALFLLISAPWFIAISILSHGAFWSASLGRDMFEKLATGKENHGFPPGSYLLAIWLTFWPAALPLAAALPAIWRLRHEALARFALLWLVPTWLVFEVTATKLVHYTLPTYPALALLLGLVWDRAAPKRLWPAILPALLPPLLMVALAWQARQLGAEMPFGFWLSALAVLAALALILTAIRGAKPVPLALALAAGGLALNTAVYPTLAGIPQLWPARPLAEAAAARPDCRFTVAGYAEPSLVFLTDNRVQFQDLAALPATLAEPGCQLVAAPQALPGLQPVAEVKGLDLGTGRKVDLLVQLKP